MKQIIKEGQVWTYKCRPHETGSRLTIIKVDTLNGEPTIHISIDGLKLKDKLSGDIFATVIEHLPFSLAAIKKSFLKNEGSIEPSINDGYLHWKELFDAGKAGIWNIEIRQAIAMTEETYNSSN